MPTFTIATQLDFYIVTFSLIAFVLAGAEMIETRGRSRLAWAVLLVAVLPLIRRVTFGA